MSQPALAPLFSPADDRTVAAIGAYISPSFLAALQVEPDALYRPEIWRNFGHLGLFNLGIPADGDLSGRDTARAIAMMGDALEGDLFSELDLAVYVQGIVALQTLHFHRDRGAAHDLLPELASGRKTFCTAYTDFDPSDPMWAEPVAGGYILSGRKWLSVNMPHADLAILTCESGREHLTAILELDRAGVSRTILKQAVGKSLYSQGEVRLDRIFVPEAHVLSAGLRRLRVWNRVMSASRLMNTISAHRSIVHLSQLVKQRLSSRLVGGHPMRSLPQFRRWVAETGMFIEILGGAITSTLCDMAANRVDEAAIAGLKAFAVRRAFALALQAQEMAGGAGTLSDNEIGRIAASLGHHKFSSGGEAQLMALYATSFARKLQAEDKRA